MTLLILYLLLALIVSFFCSIAEAVLLSVRPSFIAAMESKKKGSSNKIAILHSNLERPLAAILTANTIAHTIGAAGVGAQAAIVFGSEYLGVVSGVLTFLILIFSEIIPKTLGTVYWKKLTPIFAVLITWLTMFLTPFVWMSQKITRLISLHKNRELTYCRDEMEAMVKIGGSEGVLKDRELSVVTRLLRLNKLRVKEIMIPWSNVFFISNRLNVAEYFQKYSSEPYSRIPIYDAKKKDAVGYVLKSDLLHAQAKDEFSRNLTEFQRDFLTFNSDMNVFEIFERIIHEKSHIALIISSKGSIKGIITLEDVLEALIGHQITDELDKQV